MNILVTNDDGVFATGIKVLVDNLRKAGHSVYVAAPLEEQSGMSHSITLHSPLRMQRAERDGVFFGYSVNGKPADCVKIGLLEAFKDVEFDYVISGINRGANLGTDIFYSGTVGAAAEGAFAGKKAIALSLVLSGEDSYFETAGKFIVTFLEEISDVNFPKDSMLNINIPNIPHTELKGYKVTKQGDKRFIDDIIEREDTQGKIYYWLGGKPHEFGEEADNDFMAVREGYASVTPVKLVLHSEELKKQLINKMKKSK